jgi:hypothetical protein
MQTSFGNFEFWIADSVIADSVIADSVIANFADLKFEI